MNEIAELEKERERVEDAVRHIVTGNRCGDKLSLFVSSVLPKYVPRSVLPNALANTRKILYIYAYTCVHV
jgi:hypothetical protein